MENVKTVVVRQIQTVGRCAGHREFPDKQSRAVRIKCDRHPIKAFFGLYDYHLDFDNFYNRWIHPSVTITTDSEKMVFKCRSNKHAEDVFNFITEAISNTHITITITTGHDGVVTEMSC